LPQGSTANPTAFRRIENATERKPQQDGNTLTELRRNVGFRIERLLRVSVLAGIALLALTVCCASLNASGHTSVDPYITLALFSPLAAMGAWGLLVGRKTGLPRKLCLTAIVLGLCGIALLVYLDRSNTLLQYEKWIERGMP
jgi:peptidoglycan/LPS O-acetylase OafA/YrhL